MSRLALIEKINLIVKRHIDENKIVGWVIGIKRHRQADIFISGGYADWDNSIPMTSHKVFKIGSVTKFITSILILQLFEQKKILLNKSVRKYLPGLPTKFDAVKIINLLNHTAGLKEYIDQNRSQRFMYDKADHSEIINAISSESIDFSGQFKYSNSHYFLLGKVIELISGMEFKEYATQQLRELLGAHCFTGNWEREGDAVPLGYVQHPQSSKVTKLRPLSLYNAGAAGGLCIPAEGLLSIVRAFFNFKIVNKNLVQTAKKTFPQGEALHSQYGLGLWRMDWGKLTGFGHGGGTLRFTSAAFHIPEKQMEIVILTNTGWSTGILPLVGDLAVKMPLP